MKKVKKEMENHEEEKARKEKNGQRNK